MRRKKLKDDSLINELFSYTFKKYIPFHMPGHKLGNNIQKNIRKNIFKADVTELSYSDDLHYPDGIIKKAQEKAAKAYGAQKTFFLVNGSSSGILSSIAAVCKKKDQLIITRNCHRSAVNAMTVFDIEPVYVKAGYDKDLMIPYPSTQKDILDAIEKNPGAKGIFITSPNYYGISLDIDRIIKAAHLKKMPVIIDEAHGAHYNFSKLLPESFSSKADICIQSAHKTLPVVSQGAFMHVNEGFVDLERLRHYKEIFHTSSPSYMIMALLDNARKLMENKGEALTDKLCKNIDHLTGSTDIRQIKFFKKDMLIGDEYDKDKTRIVINTTIARICGYDLERFLKEEYGIFSEMADMYNVILFACIKDKEKWFKILHKGLKDFLKKNIKYTEFKRFDAAQAIMKIPEKAAGLSETFLKESEKVSIKDSNNRISKNIIAPYPPGIPVLCPGEKITGLTASYLYDIIKNEGYIQGIDKDGMIEVLK